MATCEHKETAFLRGRRKHLVCLFLLLTATFPVAGAQFDKKVVQSAIRDHYKKKTNVVLKSGLSVSYCVQRGLYGNSSVLPVNEDISGEIVTLDAHPVGITHGFLASTIHDVNALGCSGPMRIPVQPGEEVTIDYVDVWAREGTPIVELYVRTVEPRIQERTVLGTTVSSLDRGSSDWLFVLNPASKTDIFQAAINAIDPWLKPFNSREEASTFASGIRNAANTQQRKATTHVDTTSSSESATPASALQAQKEPSEPSKADMATVLVKSTPDGADITVDGKFVGSTPSTLKLGSGEHKLTVGKSGFRTWERIIALSTGGTVTINPTLEQLTIQIQTH